MTAGELMTKLQNFDPEQSVFVQSRFGDCACYCDLLMVMPVNLKFVTDDIFEIEDNDFDFSGVALT